MFGSVPRLVGGLTAGVRTSAAEVATVSTFGNTVARAAVSVLSEAAGSAPLSARYIAKWPVEDLQKLAESIEGTEDLGLYSDAAFVRLGATLAEFTDFTYIDESGRFCFFAKGVVVPLPRVTVSSLHIAADSKSVRGRLLVLHDDLVRKHAKWCMHHRGSEGTSTS